MDVEFRQPELDSEEIFQLYVKKVEYIARKISAKLPRHASIQFEDLLQAGKLGLMDAIDKFDSEHGAAFGTYAEFRIRGSILDFLRGEDPRSRTEREKINAHNQIIQEYDISASGGLISVEEYAHMAEIDEDEALKRIKKYGHRTYSQRNVSLDKKVGDEDSNFLIDLIRTDDQEDSPEAITAKRDTLALMMKIIKNLPDRLKKVIEEYYFDERKLKEIGKELNVTESRASQLLKEAITKIKKELIPALEEVKNQTSKRKLPAHPQSRIATVEKTLSIPEGAQILLKLLRENHGRLNVSQALTLLEKEGFKNHWGKNNFFLMQNLAGELFSNMGHDVFFIEEVHKVSIILGAGRLCDSLADEGLQGTLKEALKNAGHYEEVAFREISKSLEPNLSDDDVDQRQFFIQLLIKLAMENVTVFFREDDRNEQYICLNEDRESSFELNFYH